MMEMKFCRVKKDVPYKQYIYYRRYTYPTRLHRRRYRKQVLVFEV